MALVRSVFYIVCCMMLIGCGGGGGGLSDGGTTPDPDPNPQPDNDGYVITLDISNRLITEASPATISAKVTQSGSVVPNKLVIFATTRGQFSPESGTALTGENGVATIVLKVGEAAGAGTVSASLSTGEKEEIDFTTELAPDKTIILGAGEPFVAGRLNITPAVLSAGGTAEVSVELRDEDGELYSDTIDINFSSICSDEANASATIDQIVRTSSGKAKATYLAKGCVGDDLITANAIVNGQNLTANGSINVLPADVGSIEFVSATPEHIAIQGTGSNERPESAVVVFLVKDTDGNVVNNRQVNFVLSSEAGNVGLNPFSATTNGDGLVQTVVSSGTVARTIRVIATVNGTEPAIQTTSSELKISTGIPDQDSTSISLETLNPEAWDTDGVEVPVTIRLADAFNNPPPPTAVTFVTEGGSIETLNNTCITDSSGACTVIWRSQLPRPEGETLSRSSCYSTNPELPTAGCAHYAEYLGQKYGGRTTILATAIGEESFPDLNGNGRFDVCEVPAFTGGVGKPCNSDGTFNQDGVDINYSGNDVSGSPFDIHEAHLEHNEDWIFNPATQGGMEGGELEELVDFNNNGLYEQKDGVYNGVLCALPEHQGCSDTNAVDVRSSGVLVMSGSTAFFNTVFPVSADGTIPTVTIQGEGSAGAAVVIADLHNQQMPAGSSVEFESTVGSIVQGGGLWPNSNYNGGAIWSATIKGESEPKSGQLIVTVTTPGGLISTHTVANIQIQ